MRALAGEHLAGRLHAREGMVVQDDSDPGIPQLPESALLSGII